MCDRCGRGRYARDRRSTTERGYGADWRRLSTHVRQEQPLCVVCRADGRVTASQHCHHVVKVRDARERRMDESNVMAVCVACHEVLDALYESDRAAYAARITIVRAAMAAIADAAHEPQGRHGPVGGVS